MTRPTRRAILVIPDEVLDTLLTTEARLDLPHDTHVIGSADDRVRQATLILIAGPELDVVAPGFEPPILPTTIIEPPR